MISKIDAGIDRRPIIVRDQSARFHVPGPAQLADTLSIGPSHIRVHKSCWRGTSRIANFREDELACGQQWPQGARPARLIAPIIAEDMKIGNDRVRGIRWFEGKPLVKNLVIVEATD